MDKVFLRKGRSASLSRFHPWVFSGAVARVEGHPAEGDLVEVWGVDEGEPAPLGVGHWQSGSIAVRILRFAPGPLPQEFWEERLRAARALRKACGLDGNPETTCHRLVHGEGDGLPGLVVDWYDGVCVLQAHSAGMLRAQEEVCAALRAVYGEALRAVYGKSAATAPHRADLAPSDGYLWVAEGAEDSCGRRQVLESGHRFWVDWESGQKTGFFLDQRENRRLVERLATGRTVLNLFCYTGGFSVYALCGGAARVDSVDTSAKALELLQRNLALNGLDDPGRHSAHCTDGMDFLRNVPEGMYDLMVVDPPAFAKHRDALRTALRAYQRLNACALSRVARGGFVLTFSCSQVVDRETFACTVFSAAAEAGRRVRILERLGQPADHPVDIFHPEGAYLKGLLLYVE